MKNKMLRSFVLLVCFPVLMLVMLSPAYAITTTVKPSDAINGTNTDAYTATLDPAGASADIFNLNISIPAGYTLTLPAAGRTVGNYTMFDITQNKNKVFINITSNNPATDKVDVTFSTDYGATSSPSNNQNISNMSIGASTLNITRPTTDNAGYFNLSLGGTAGPISPTNNRVTLTLANGTLTNPSAVGTKTWVLVAKSDPAGAVLFTQSNDVRIAAGASSAVSIPVFNSTTPANASLALPSGNLTVNITTTAAGNVTNFAITLRNFSLGVDVNPATAGAVGRTKFMFFGVDAPALALSDISFTATIRVNYSSLLPTLTISETDLTLFRFNDTSQAWEPSIDGTVVNTTTRIASGNFTSLSTFAIMGAAAAGGGDGAGGGGGGVTTSEPYTNIEKSERYDKSLIANTSVTYTFKAPELSIYEIGVTGKENENDIALRVEALKATSKLVTVQPPGTVYKNVNVWAGTKRIKEALIRFKVENTWLGGNNVASSDVKMVKWDGSKWVQIETSEKTRDTTYTYYEAKTDTFSVFAITGLKGVVVPTATPAVVETILPTPTEAAVPTAVPTEKAVGIKDILSITTVVLGVIIIILAAVYLFKRKRG